MTTLSTIDTKTFFYSTLRISVIVQIITGIIEIITLFFTITTPPQYNIINHLLYLELTVQIIEGSFYIWLVYNFNKVTNITSKRYVDWAITTPTMLITLMVYLIYLGYRSNNIDTTGMTLFGTLKDNMDTVSKIITLNWLMLLFGYMSEIKILSTVAGVLMGFIPFLIYYYIIYYKYATQSSTGLKIFWYFFFFWSIYGIAALLPYNLKNSIYNILDLFAKNFFGIFLAYIVITKKY
jgi:bacteriorhodopsin